MSDAIDQFSDEAIERYARHLVLPEVGVDGQLALGQAHMAIIGCGGLGAHAALALCQAGVGRLEVFDPDLVELSNLHRQPFRHDQIGQPKAESLAALCGERNALVQVEAHVEAFVGCSARIWLDCTDTYDSRVQIDGLRGPATQLVFGSVLGMDAQVTVFDAGAAGFGHTFPHQPKHQGTCAEQGVLGPLASLVAQLMATEAIRLAQGQPSPLARNLLLIDGRDWRFMQMERS